MFGVVEVDIHADADERHDDDVQQVLARSHLRQPACLCALVNDADLAGAFGHFPHDDIVGNQLSGDVVHHQGEQRLIGVPLGFEHRRNPGPDRAGDNAADHHQEDKQPVGDLVAEEDHTGRSSKAAHQHLSFSAEVPAAHAEGRRHGQRYTEENSDVLKEHPCSAAAAEGALEDRDVYAERIQPGHQRGQKGAGQKCEDQCEGPDAPGLIPGQRAALCHMEERIMLLTVHLHFLPVLSSSCRRHACSRHGRARCR